MSLGMGKTFAYIRGDFYFKIREREAMVDEHFRRIFRDMQARRNYESIFLMSDSCSASTPFETVDIADFVGLASSSLDEKSLSHGFDNELNSPKSDDFTFFLDEYLTKNDPKHNNIEIKHLLKYLSF